MENFTPTIEQLLQEKLGLYRQLNDVMILEKQSIVEINVDALWKSNDEKQKIAKKIQTLRGKILSHMEKSYSFSDMDINSFSMTYLIRHIPLSSQDKSRLRKLKLAIEEQKNQLTQTALDNKKYVNEYMTVIDDIMSVAVDNSHNAQYTKVGSVPGSKTERCLIHAEV